MVEMKNVYKVSVSEREVDGSWKTGGEDKKFLDCVCFTDKQLHILF
jgi:hypothetical protein